MDSLLYLGNALLLVFALTGKFLRYFQQAVACEAFAIMCWGKSLVGLAGLFEFEKT